MNPSTLSLLRCPKCLDVLDMEGDQLRCRSCSAVYPVVNGIPRFVPPDNYAKNFGLQWNRFRKTQLDSHSGLPISRTRFLDQTTWTAADLTGKRILDAGCGAGRFAEVALSLGAEVVAVDYSSAVDACASNLGDHPNLHVLQANIYALPFAHGTFDFIYSLGVLQHTPDVKVALLSLCAFLKPGGRLTVDLYLKNLAMWLHPRVWMRPITTRMDPTVLFGIVERWVPPMLALSRAVGRIPLLGRFARRFIPVANYDGVFGLSSDQLKEWAVLDTYDWLAPKYDQPQTAQTLQAWLEAAGLERIEVLRAHHLTGRAKKPATARAS